MPCSDTTQPTSPSDPSAGPGNVIALQQPDDPIALARQVPGFGGFFFDQQGQPTVYLKEEGGRPAAERALLPYFSSHGLRTSSLRVRRADFDWASLERWQQEAGTEALSMRGTVYVDADESRNRVTIGVERGTSAAQVRAAVARRGVPVSAVIVEEVEPVTLAATLRNRIRPVPGGVQIHFPGFLCTLGFSATRSGQRSFITNSHCTTVQGGTEATPYWQPTQSATTRIATEVQDPAYGQGGGCPLLRRCRRSDAARARYASGTGSQLGRIARTTGANNNSLTISGRFTITGEGNPVVGQTANKVGRTTGWTRGTITNTCVHVNVSGSNITQLCQSIVSAGVGSGDSGSPVFRRPNSSSNNVTLLGILWGGSGSSTFVFSPISNIEAELGALTTF